MFRFFEDKHKNEQRNSVDLEMGRVMMDEIKSLNEHWRHLQVIANFFATS